MTMTAAVDPDSSPLPARCPVCRRWLISDGAEALICGKRGGCGAEWDFDTIRGRPVGL